MIVIQHLTKTYDKQTVLSDITLTLQAGTIYGLVGVNGSGKTTLMRCMCGFSKPSAGSVVCNGKIIGKDLDFPPKTGIIIESPGFLPNYSGLRNLEILAAVSGTVTKARMIEVITLVGLDPSDKKPVGKYSLGMRQRLGIAQAIMEDPDNLILDEPFNGLDSQGIKDVHSLLSRLKAQGKCILLASHSAYDIAQACDQVFTLRDGRLTETPVERMPCNALIR
ncbi:MAG: ATP-binding cassette domain-containing protein [Candidatus Limiplasma sp.]|nr:ATP-binding cassette domain-containing protein [Candidatus Limiplasma sp.]